MLLALSLLGPPAVDGARIGAASSLRGSTSKSPMNRILRRLTPILRKEIASSGGGRRKNSNKETRDEGEETVLELLGGGDKDADTAGKTKVEDVNKEASQQTEQSEKSADDKIII
mmetsp:Transcript_28489/g.77146  ORF Transcript_28489/g.77146 Transcript_28489/m.77146 type:complete len:115 (-) Transcript_28489:92-436(-)